ncbi:MAG: hypothetical protein EPGJADBJ_02583 [Saprospiraceae bacterium]|nr:hypothetical protein [Saprospiraceae bacterium]
MTNNKVLSAVLSLAGALLIILPLRGQWGTARLSEARFQPQVVVAANKALFVGGKTDDGRGSTRVDIYDANTGSWSLYDVPNPSRNLYPDFSAVAHSAMVFATDHNSMSGEIWIYNAASNGWTTAMLLEPRRSVSVGIAGDYVVFAGGALSPDALSRTVDLYNVKTNTWRAIQLSEPRTGIAIAGVGKQILLAGGYKTDGVSDVVDILNTETWRQTIYTLPEKRAQIEAIAAGNKALLAGGEGPDGANTNTVSIYDADFNEWISTTMTLDGDAGSLYSAVVGNKVYFIGDDNRSLLDVYDAASGTWDMVPVPVQHAAGSFAAAGDKLFLADVVGSVQVYDCVSSMWDTLGNLSVPRSGLSAITVGDKLLFAGGYCCSGNSDVVDIYTGISGRPGPPAPLTLQPPYPNPAHTRLFVPLPPDATYLRLFNSEGCLEQSHSVDNLEQIVLDVSGLRTGTYLIAVEGKGGAVYRGRISVE